MSNSTPSFSVEVNGEAQGFFHDEDEAEEFAKKLIKANDTAIITISNLVGPDNANYSHKYWSWSNKKWEETSFP